MKRILILGSCGAGKTTLALILSEITRLPIIHLDQEYWQPNWVETPKEIWEEKVKKLSKKEEYIMDGNYAATLDMRLKQADMAIYLDTSTLTNLYRVLNRTWKYHGEVRPNMPAGCKERFDFEFLHYVLAYKRISGNKVIDLLEKGSTHLDVRMIRNQDDIQALITSLREKFM